VFEFVPGTHFQWKKSRFLNVQYCKFNFVPRSFVFIYFLLMREDTSWPTNTIFFRSVFKLRFIFLRIVSQFMVSSSCLCVLHFDVKADHSIKFRCVIGHMWPHCRTLGIFSEHFDQEWEICTRQVKHIFQLFNLQFRLYYWRSYFIYRKLNCRHHTVFFNLFFGKKKLILVSIGVLCKTVRKTASIIKCSRNPSVVWATESSRIS
jgi:hypothetical protein